jgi:ribosomal protein S18 acetylase RimI-like enzyme
MPSMQLIVRPARPEDPADELLYESAKPYYDAYAGDEARARRLLRRVYRRDGHAASWEICHVAELDGEVIGVLAGFPAREGDRLARHFVSLTFARVPAWRWPGLVRHLRAAGTVSPLPPLDAYYVDALATAPQARRRGVATALLSEAERQARTHGASGVALDTGLANQPARALYESYGFRRREVRHAPDERTARAIGGPGFVGYFKDAAD